MKLWKNGQFYTMENQSATIEAMVTGEGTILGTGSLASLRKKFQNEIQEEIDLAGKTLFPGFVDSHMHVLWYGQSLARLNLKACTSKKEALQMIAQKEQSLAADEWLFVEGYNENNWIDVGTGINREDLDLISEERPILVRRIDYHNVSINTPLIEEIGLISGQIFSGGGEIVLDDHGELTGVLKDEATLLAVDAFPESSQTEIESYIQLAVKDLWSKGITGAHTEDLHYFNGFAGTLAAFRNMLGEDKLPFRAQLLIHHEELAAYVRSGEHFIDGDDYTELGAMKIFYDGTVGSQTALMSATYPQTEDYHGLQIHTDEAFEELVKAARMAKLPVAIHILGDLAFEKVIQMLKKYPPIAGQQDRMIHTPWLTAELIEAGKGMPLIFDVQPQFMSSDLPWALEVLGEEHPPLAFAWKSLLNAGFDLAGGSDAPVEIPNPFFGIAAAVTRVASDGKPYFEDQALSLFEAISLYTTGSAKASYRSTTRGKLAPGYVADFTILAENPYELALADLKNLKVAQTVVGEKVVFEA